MGGLLFLVVVVVVVDGVPGEDNDILRGRVGIE